MFKKWSDWKDIQVRSDSSGSNYLLQVRERTDGKKQFRNILMDKGIGISIFHTAPPLEKIKEVLKIKKMSEIL
jgi:hypothetical protein